MSGFGFGARPVTRRRRLLGGPPMPALSALSLSPATIAENSAPGVVIGALGGRTSGSALTLADDAGGRFALAGANIVTGLVATDFEAATSHSITVRETLAGATGSPRDTVLSIAVTNVFEAPNLGALTLSSTSFTVGTPASGTITGATAGSAIVASGLPAGLTINGPARSFAWDGTGTAGTPTITLTETLADSANSPRATAIAVTVAAAAPTVPISSVNADGWSGIWASGTPPTFTPDTAPQTFSLSRAGFDAGGAATSYAATRLFARRVRQPYPNQALDTASSVALDDYVYATDTIAGVTNNSAETSPVPVAAWVMPGRQVVGNALPWELVAFHRDGQAGRQVACVIVTATDGTTTVSQTVSATAISSLCEDANPVEVYRGSIDITALNAGLVTLNARVFPWIGGAAAVLDSAASSVAREFSPRYFRKDTSRAATPALAYVSSTGSDTTGVWSTTAATALATPFLTVGGALTAVNDATRGTPATGGITDGCRIRIVNTVSIGTVATARSQNIAAVTVERAPGTARSAAIVTLGAAFRPRLGVGSLNAAFTEGALVFSDVTINRTVNVAFTGEAANQLQLHLWNVSLTNNSVAGAWLSNAHDYYYGLALTGFNGNIGQTGALQHRLMRGLVCDFAGGTGPESWVTIGCALTRAKGGGYLDATRGAIYYANRFINPDSTQAPIAIDTVSFGQTITGFVVVQNLIETTHTSASTPSLRISSDTPLFGNTVHAIVLHNTMTGYGSVGRGNIFYDNSSGVRTHRLARDAGNIYVQLNTKGDVFVGSTASFPNPETHIGQFPYHHGVGCQGNWSMFAVNSATAFSEVQAYPGPASSIGTSTTVRLDPLFVNYQGTGGSGGVPSAGAGGGNYALQAGSPARARVARVALGFDLAGVARGSGAQACGAYG